MQTPATITLKSDCPAIQIPSGEDILLPAGTTLDITQTLGGSYTVRGMGGLFRIAAANAAALGIEAGAAESGEATAEGPLSEDAVWAVLKTCYDPEIPVNIVDLGLVYDLALEPLTGGLHKVAVKMTLTAPGCGMDPSIAADAQEKLSMLPGVGEASVDIVWEPAWHQSMITAEGRRILGLE